MVQDQFISGTLKSVVVPSLVSIALVAPFIAFQLINRRAFHKGFPFLLFAFMFLHSLLIVVSVTPALRRLRMERSLRTLGPGHWLGLLLGVFLIAVYANVIIDQLPCFFGVPNCD